MSTTVKSNLIIPEVLAGYIEQKLIDNIVFAPLCDIDNTLVGNDGDKLKLPKYSYIGAADVTAENAQITPVNLQASSTEVAVHKITKAVQITDEARLSAYGDPMNEIGAQLLKSLGDKTDKEILTQMEGAEIVVGLTAISSDAIVDALAEGFGEDQDDQKALILCPKDLAVLRKDDDYINKSEIATDMLISGSTGMIWGCNLIPANRLTPGSSAKHKDAYIVKPGALGLLNKRGVFVESKREPDYQRDTVYASKMYAPYVKNESKIIRIVIFTGLDTVSDGVVTSVAGTTAANDTFIKISEPAPIGYKWVYKLGSSDVTPTWGTAVSSYTDWVSGTTEISASTSTKASVVLVNESDDKPVKYTNITLTKKS